MEMYTGTLPDGWTQTDGAFAATAAGLTPAGVNVTGRTITLICKTAQPAAAVAAWQASLTGTPPTTPARTAEQIDQALADAMARMQQIADWTALPAGTLTAAQLSDAARTNQTATKAIAATVRRIIRVMRADFDGAT